ncbi:PREDICTED: auxin-responsive protein SAUR71 [Camelina sativa]|uniref:Auxin-responsive protein SAUR71 n=1 Tax=Camelina sativa TaxID=90675 RepID=A0ABM0X0X3_CAMSA|nr:PREDICTED: auxin-responsive protein SAUR71 [Camelina sativa]
MKCVVKKLLCCGAKSFSQRETLPEEGRVRVYVGNDRDTQCKLEMDADLLTHPLFENLLRLSEEEFGHSYDGALRIACEIQVFMNLIHYLKSTSHSPHYMNTSPPSQYLH